jgi:hypothetical protein
MCGVSARTQPSVGRPSLLCLSRWACVLPGKALTPHSAAAAALKMAVHPTAPRKEVGYVIQELLKRLHDASDWLVGWNN